MSETIINYYRIASQSLFMESEVWVHLILSASCLEEISENIHQTQFQVIKQLITFVNVRVFFYV